MQRTISQNNRLYALLSRLRVDKETQDGLVFEYTKGRSKSSKDMTIPECQALINNLQHMVNQISTNTPPPVRPTNDASNKMRRKILSICHEMRWTINGHLDWKRINDFLIKSGYLHIPLNAYKQEELPKLVTQFEQLLKTYYAQR